MAKHPVPGQVKTRLAATLGADVACALYRAFILDLAERLPRLGYAITWAYWPATAPFPALVPEARCRPQHGRDLGERLAAAIAAEFRAGDAPVLVIGADVPHLSADDLREAATALGRDTDVVLGPAADGGYYLIGLRAPAPELFRDIDWGTAGVLVATRARASQLGLRTHLLPPSFDIDEVADLDRLRGLLAGGGVDLPRTATVLAGVGRAPSP